LAWGSIIVGNVHPIARIRSFDPDTLQIMGVALDCAWYKLLASGSALTASWRAEHTREALASQIVASAQLGEHDVERLCDVALAHVQGLVVEPRKASTGPLIDSGICGRGTASVRDCTRSRPGNNQP
jgi:hypothetical protein